MFIVGVIFTNSLFEKKSMASKIYYPVGTTDQIIKEIFQNRPELKNKIYIASVGKSHPEQCYS